MVHSITKHWNHAGKNHSFCKVCKPYFPRFVFFFFVCLFFFWGGEGSFGYLRCLVGQGVAALNRKLCTTCQQKFTHNMKSHFYGFELYSEAVSKEMACVYLNACYGI